MKYYFHLIFYKKSYSMQIRKKELIRKAYNRDKKSHLLAKANEV